MRVMMLSTPFQSHAAGLFPLAWALRLAGHEVLVVGQPEITDAAVEAGLCAVVAGDRFDGNDLLLCMLPEGKRPIHVVGRRDYDAPQVAHNFWGTHARYLLPRYLEFARSWAPDLVVSEQMEFAGLVVGGAQGVPTVMHRWGVDPLSKSGLENCALLLDGVARRLGLDGLPMPALILDPCPPALQVPSALPGHPIRYIPYNGTGLVPPWARPRADVRRVCVCLGRHTLALNGIPLLRSIIDAFEGVDDIEAVVTADAATHEAIGPVPATVRLVAPTPINVFLDTCVAMVHHGGNNVAMTATSFGLPQLVLPQFEDQFIIGDNLVAAGAARAVEEPARQDDPAEVREALLALLADPGHAKAAAELRDAMAAMPSPAEVVPLLEEIAAG